MDPAAKVIIWIYGTIAAISLVLVIYFIMRRIEIKKKEDFEARDN